MIRGSVEGIDATITGLDNATLEIRQAAFQGVLLAINAAFKACETTLSPTDHTLRDLALMGHPYSVAHGHVIHQPDELVHLQSGEYRAALRKISPRGMFGDILEGEVKIDESMADRDRWIQEGTTLMRARPWMRWILRNYGQDFVDIIIARVNQALKAA